MADNDEENGGCGNANAGGSSGSPEVVSADVVNARRSSISSSVSNEEREESEKIDESELSVLGMGEEDAKGNVSGLRRDGREKE